MASRWQKCQGARPHSKGRKAEWGGVTQFTLQELMGVHENYEFFPRAAVPLQSLGSEEYSYLQLFLYLRTGKMLIKTPIPTSQINSTCVWFLLLAPDPSFPSMQTLGGSSSYCVPESILGIWIGFPAPGFGLSQPWQCGRLGNESVNGYFLLCLFVFQISNK